MAVVFEDLSAADINDIQSTIDRVVQILYENTLEEGDNFLFDPYPDIAGDHNEVNFGAYYDSLDNFYQSYSESDMGADTGWVMHAQGYPIGESTDFDLLERWAQALERQTRDSVHDDTFFWEDSDTYVDDLANLRSWAQYLADLVLYLGGEPMSRPTSPSEIFTAADPYTAESVEAAAATAITEALATAGTAAIVDADTAAGTMGLSPDDVAVSCGDVEEPAEEELECPPPCIEDPKASIPDWTILTDKEPFFNGRTCEYSITILTEYEGSPEQVKADASVLNDGVVKLLEFYGKKTEVYTVINEDGSEGETVDPIALCTAEGSVKEAFVPVRALLKTLGCYS